LKTRACGFSFALKLMHTHGKTGKSAEIGTNACFSLTAQTQQFQWFATYWPVQRRCISFTLVCQKQQGRYLHQLSAIENLGESSFPKVVLSIFLSTLL